MRAFDVRADRLDARDVYRAESGESSSDDVAYSAESDTLFVATRELTGMSACARSPAQTTVGLLATECNSRGGRSGSCNSARSARRESVRLRVLD